MVLWLRSGSGSALDYALFAGAVPLFFYDQAGTCAHETAVGAVYSDLHGVGAACAYAYDVLAGPLAGGAAWKGAAVYLHAVHQHAQPGVAAGHELDVDILGGSYGRRFLGGSDGRRDGRSRLGEAGTGRYEHGGRVE